MATSGSINFNTTRNEIIAGALMLLGVYRPGATISANDYTFCSTQLNSIIKRWQTKGLHLWTETEGTLFLTENQNIYTVSSTTTDYLGKNTKHTNLTEDCSSTSVTVENTIGMTAADNIILILDDNTKHITTITSVDSTTTLTINTSPASTASNGNSVFSYTSTVGRILYIKSARLRSKDGTERPLKVYGRDEFMQIPNKNSSGSILGIYYAPNISSGLLYAYLTPDDINDSINFSYIRIIEDFDNSTDEPDLPQEWIDALILNLAVRVAITYGRQLRLTNPELITEAQQSLLDLQLFDFEEGSSYIVPNERFDE